MGCSANDDDDDDDDDYDDDTVTHFNIIVSMFCDWFPQIRMRLSAW